MRKYPHFINTDELKDYFIARGIDCRKNSRQLTAHVRRLFECEVPLKNLILAACFAGYAVVPQRNGDNFTFCRVAD